MPGDMLGPSEGGLADWTLWGTVSRTRNTTRKRGGRRRRTLWSPAMGQEGDGSGDWEKGELSQTLAFKSGASDAPPDVSRRHTPQNAPLFRYNSSHSPTYTHSCHSHPR